MSTNYMKFGLSNSNWYTLANGTITSMETTTVARVSKAGAFRLNTPICPMLCGSLGR